MQNQIFERDRVQVAPHKKKQELFAPAFSI
jgi:hypothetical protein